MATKPLLFIAFFVAIVICLTPSLAFADLPDPQTLEIESAECFRHMLEADDLVVVARYECTYANSTVQPDHSIDQTFLFTLYDSNQTMISNTTAYPFHNFGYGKGVVSFYLNGNRTTMDWGDLGNITIDGTSLFDAPAPNTTYTLTTEDYTSSTSPATIREELRQYIVEQATFLELSWNQYWINLGSEKREAELLMFVSPEYTVLAQAGEIYFQNSVPDIRSMCPLLFAHQLIAPAYTDINWTHTQVSEYEGQWAGTNVSTFMTATSEFFGSIQFQVIGTIAAVLFTIGIMLMCAMRGNRASPGILIAFPAVLIFTRMGWTEMAIVWLGCLVCVLLLARAYFFRESAG